MAPWALAAGVVAAALFLAAAAYFFASAQPLISKLVAGFFAIFGVLGLLDLLLSRIVLAPDDLLLISLLRRRRYPRSAFVAAKVEAGVVCLQRQDGAWLQLPSTGHNPLAVRNTVHAWIRGPAREGPSAAHSAPTDAANYRMKLTRLGHRISWGTDDGPSPRPLARARLGLQLMRGRYPATVNAVLVPTSVAQSATLQTVTAATHSR